MSIVKGNYGGSAWGEGAVGGSLAKSVSTTNLLRLLLAE